jgi:NADPH:quinone reductase-like Zn-dependent oxidoreductase
VQLARWADAHVAAVGDANDAAFVRSIGAEVYINREQRLEDAISDVDVVIDTVGGELQDSSFSVLKSGGAIVSSVSLPSEAKANATGARASFFIVCVTGGELARVADLIDGGKLRTNVGTVLPLEQSEVAHRMLAGQIPHAPGKIVLNVENTK